MFWFSAPERTDPQVLEFLAVEREYLTGDWTTAKVMLAFPKDPIRKPQRLTEMSQNCEIREV